MVDQELLDCVRRFDRVSTSFHFGLSAQLPSPSQFRLVLKRETASLVDLFLIAPRPPFFFCFHHLMSNAFVR